MCLFNSRCLNNCRSDLHCLRVSRSIPFGPFFIPVVFIHSWKMCLISVLDFTMDCDNNKCDKLCIGVSVQATVAGSLDRRRGLSAVRCARTLLTSDARFGLDALRIAPMRSILSLDALLFDRSEPPPGSVSSRYPGVVHLPSPCLATCA